MTQEFDCKLEIDNDRGVIYVHSTKTGQTLLRICHLPTPIPLVTLNIPENVVPEPCEMLDITHMRRTSWSRK